MLGSADGGFRSVDARKGYLKLYDDVRAFSPQPDVIHDAPTEFGAVTVYQHGPADGIPVVLIHGFFLTSAMWWRQIEGLSGQFTLYTLDMLGQPGAGLQSRAMLTPAHAARFIDAVLTVLDLHDVHLVAHSYGGWIAAHTAAHTPSRLATLTLIDPAHTVTRLSAECWRNFAILLSRPNSARARRAAAWVNGDPEPGSPTDKLAELFRSGFAAFATPVRTPHLSFPGNRLLRSVPIPVQVLLAGNTVHDSTRAIRRIRSVTPNWRTHLWPNASHSLYAEVSDEVNACIRDFAIANHG